MRRTCLCCLMSFVVSLALAQADYGVVTAAKVGGDGGWDYLTVDGANKRLYIARGTHVQVLDSESLKQVGDVADTPGVHQVALVPELGRGFASSGRADSVKVFGLKNLETITDVKVGSVPDSIIYESISGRVLTFNARSHDATAIDAKTAKVVGTVALGGKPEFAVADGHGNVFVNIEDTAEIARFDARGLKVLNRWKMDGCDAPTGLAFDDAHGRLFSVCQNSKMMVVDSKSGKVVTTVPIGEGVDGAAFDAERQLIFSSNGRSGTLTVVHEDSPEKFTVIQNVPTAMGARTLALDPKSHKVFTVTKTDGVFEVLVVAPE